MPPVAADRSSLHAVLRALGDALVREGLGAVAGRPYAWSGSWFFLVLGMANSLSIWATVYQRASPEVGVVSSVLFVLALWRLPDAITTVILFGAVAGTLLWQLIAGGVGAAAVTHGVPHAVVACIAFFRFDLRALARSLPLVAPLVVLLLLVPLLTAETWEASQALDGGGLAAIALVLTLPVLVALFVRLNARIPQAYEAASERALGDAEELPTRVAPLIRRVGGDRAAEQFRDEAMPFLAQNLTVPVKDLVAEVRESSARTLRRTLARRLLPTTLVLGAAITGYLYAIAAIAIDEAVAQKWSGAAGIPELLGLGLPAGPYLKVAGLLGIVATAVFLALVLTEERYSEALTKALLDEPAYESVVLGVPYLALEQALAEPPDPDGAVSGEASPSPGTPRA
jgi:hypothetical protein